MWPLAKVVEINHNDAAILCSVPKLFADQNTDGVVASEGIGGDLYRSSKQILSVVNFI